MKGCENVVSYVPLNRSSQFFAKKSDIHAENVVLWLAVLLVTFDPVPKEGIECKKSVLDFNENLKFYLLITNIYCSIIRIRYQNNFFIKFCGYLISDMMINMILTEVFGIKNLNIYLFRWFKKTNWLFFFYYSESLISSRKKAAGQNHQKSHFILSKNKFLKK